MTAGERIEEVVQKCFGWHPKTDEETCAEGLVYSAVSGYLEALEATGMYQGNGHHLAQRVAALVTMAMYPQGGKREG